MSYSYKLSRRIARLRLPLLAVLASAFAACNAANTLNPDTSADTPTDPTVLSGNTSETVTPVDGSTLSNSFAAGMPFGSFAQPVDQYGSLYNGGKETVGPYEIKATLAAIKSRGGRVVIMMAGSDKYYKDASGHFSLTKWKQRIDRYKGIDFTSYINDGTIIGHFMIDEPQDPTNWNGTTVSPSTLDAMGQYSKQLWPGMATVVRVVPKYFTSNPRYVDATWAQYLARFGSVTDFVRSNVSDAKARGLALIVGLNVIDGGTPKLTPMTATEVKSYGSALLADSYPCAFVSWQYQSSYFSSSSILDAMKYLRSKAASHAFKACRGS